MRIASLLLALLVSAPAYAEFTAQEKTSLQHGRAAMDALLDLLEGECGVSGTETSCIATLRGFYELTRCVGWLFHVNVNPNDTVGETFLGGPREDVVAEAWVRRGRALFELGKATGFTSHPNYLAAVAEINAMDNSLSYSDPFPPSYPKQFGPHGDYSQAQKHLWSQIQYGNSALQGWLNGQLVGELPPCPLIFRYYPRSLRNGLVDAWFMSAHVIDPTAEFANYQTPFVEALPDDDIAKRGLTELQEINGPGDGENSATYRLNLVGQNAAACLATAMPNLREFLRRYADSWGNVDAWTGHFTKIQ